LVDISEFREEIQLGDCVSLTYVYNQNRYTVEGVVIKLSDRSVRVQNQDGTTSRVELADLEGYRSIPPQGMVSIQQIVQRTVETKQEVIQPKTVVTTAVQNTVPVQTLLPMMPVMVPHQMQALQNRFLNAEAMDSEKIANIEGIRDRLAVGQRRTFLQFALDIKRQNRLLRQIDALAVIQLEEYYIARRRQGRHLNAIQSGVFVGQHIVRVAVMI
jgi:hypothetical protein